MNILTRMIIAVLFNALTFYLLTRFVDGISYTGGIKFFILTALVISVINAFLKPIAKILSFPFIFLTGGVFLIVINVGVLWFLTYFIHIVKFRDVTLAFQNFETYVIGAVVFGLINWSEHLIFKTK